MAMQITILILILRNSSEHDGIQRATFEALHSSCILMKNKRCWIHGNNSFLLWVKVLWPIKCPKVVSKVSERRFWSFGSRTYRPKKFEDERLEQLLQENSAQWRIIGSVEIISNIKLVFDFSWINLELYKKNTELTYTPITQSSCGNFYHRLQW